MILMALLSSFFLLLSSSGSTILDETAGIGPAATTDGGAVTGSGGIVTDDEGAVAPSTVPTNEGGSGWGEASTDDGTESGLETAVASGTNVDGILPAEDEGTDSVWPTEGPSGMKSTDIN